MSTDIFLQLTCPVFRWLLFLSFETFSFSFIYTDSISILIFQNTSACFLKWGKSKYAHISVYGAMTLFKTEFGPFRDKSRVDRLRNEILSALKENGLSYQESAPEMEKRKSLTPSDERKLRLDPNFANLSNKFPPIRYMRYNCPIRE